jgi:hypothetical protein
MSNFLRKILARCESGNLGTTRARSETGLFTRADQFCSRRVSDPVNCSYTKTFVLSDDGRSFLGFISVIVISLFQPELDQLV